MKHNDNFKLLKLFLYKNRNSKENIIIIEYLKYIKMVLKNFLMIFTTKNVSYI